MATGTRPARCAEIVPDGMVMRPCRRPAGHGREGAYCRQHAAINARIRRNLEGRAGPGQPPESTR